MPKIAQQSLYPEDRRMEVRPFIPEGVLRVLYVGCGPGGFGRTLRDALPDGAYVAGMDAVKENVVAARATGDYHVMSHGFFPEDVQQPTVPYDLITFLDVLEHMVDPWSALEHARGLLGDGGYVLAAIPNIQVWTTMRQLLRGRWDYTDTGTLDRTHLRFFTRATMIEMFENAGYAVRVCEGVNPPMQGLPRIRAYVNRRMFMDMKWLTLIVPDSRWLQFVLVGEKLAG